MSDHLESRSQHWSLRSASRIGLLLGVVALVVAVVGCPTTSPPFGECNVETANIDCDDDDPCTADSCDEGGSCVNQAIDGCCLTDGDCAIDELCVARECVASCMDDSSCPDNSDCTVQTCTEGVCLAAVVSCDDDDSCTNDACEEGIGCVNTPMDCGDDDECTDDICVDGMCENTPMDCGDTDECTEDTCAGGVCENVAVHCPDGEVCQDGVCVPTCSNNAECDDADDCTDDRCSDGICENTPIDCGDADDCTEDTCDGGFCENVPVECPNGGMCVDGACPVACTQDSDCADDAVFCNGLETCDNGVCISSGNPCADDQSCSETGVCMCPASSCFVLTLGEDTGPAFHGGSCDDCFSAPLAFDETTGANIPTLQTGDSLDGGEGTDTMTATFLFAAATTLAPTVTSIEIFNISDFGSVGSTTIAGSTITGLTDINISHSTNTSVLIITDLDTFPNVSLADQQIGLTMTAAPEATSGTDDTQTLSLSSVTNSPTVTLTSGTSNGVETLNIVSNDADNELDDIAMNGGTLSRVNVSGSAKFTLSTSLDLNVTTVDATDSSGGVVLTQDNTSAFVFTGGSGDDTLLLGANYGSTDTLDGGSGGTDTLGGTTAALGDTTTTQSNVINFDVLRVSDEHTTTLNVQDFGAITEVTLDAGANGGIVFNADSGVMLSCGFRGGTSAGSGSLGLTIKGVGTSDTATLTMNDAEQAGNVTTTGAETLNLVSNLDLDGTAANTGIAGQNTFYSSLVMTDTASIEKLVVTGTEQLNIVGGVGVDEIDASGMTEPFIMGTETISIGLTVTGGLNADTLFGSIGADVLNGGQGADIVNPRAGVDLVSGGAGADTFRVNVAGATGVDRMSITDFDDTPITGDVLNVNTGLATLTGTNNFADSTSIQTHSAVGNLTVNAVAEVVVVTSGTVSDFDSANSLDGTNLLTAIGGTITGAMAGQNDILICVAETTTGDVGVYYATSANNAIINTEISLIAVLQGPDVAIASLVFNSFSNDA